MLRRLFRRASYVLLEDPDVRARARSGPRTLIEELRLPVLLDEIQNAPELFAYIRTQIDRQPRKMGQWLFTGSQETPLMQGVTESMGDKTPIRSAVIHRRSKTAPPTRALSPAVEALDVREFVNLLGGQTGAAASGRRNAKST